MFLVAVDTPDVTLLRAVRDRSIRALRAYIATFFDRETPPAAGVAEAYEPGGRRSGASLSSPAGR